MNNLKKTGGFTLVELIVVIAILGILAAVAVPAYSGYITKAKEAGDITQLDAIKTAAMATAAKEGAIEQIDIEVKDGVITGIVATLDVKVADESEGAAADATVNKKIELVKANTTGTGDAAVTTYDVEVADFELFYGSDKMPTMQSETYKETGTLTWYAAAAAAQGTEGNAGYVPAHDAGWIPVEVDD